MTHEQKVANARWNTSMMLWQNRSTDDANVNCACNDLQICIEMCLKHLLKMHCKVPPKKHEIHVLLRELPDSYTRAEWYPVIRQYSDTITRWHTEPIYNDNFVAISSTYEEIAKATKVLLSDTISNVTYESSLESRIQKILSDSKTSVTVDEVLSVMPSAYRNSNTNEAELRSIVLTILGMLNK